MDTAVSHWRNKERLIRLDLVPLVYDRELKDITFSINVCMDK